MKTVAYMGWLGNKNIGDEACFYAIKKFLPKNIKLITWDMKWKHNFIPDVTIVGGGTLLNLCHDVRTKAICNLQRRGSDVVFWGTGVLPNMNKLSPIVLDLLEKSKFVGVRGPISYDRILQLGYDKHRIIGDPALLFTLKKKQQKSRTIAINIGNTKNRLFGAEKKVIQNTDVLIEKLLKKKFNVILFSMWNRDDAFISQLKNYSRVHHRKFNPSVELLLNFLSGCYCTIGLKLHASVLSAAVNTPFISLAYRDKCEDFARSVGLEKWAIRTSNKQLVFKVMGLINLLPKCYNTVEKRLHAYRTTYALEHKKLSKLVKGIIK